jgi:hypothetical protein
LDAFQKVQACPSNALESTWHIVYVVHGMESSGKFCQGIKNIVKKKRTYTYIVERNVHTHSIATPIPT